MNMSRLNTNESKINIQLYLNQKHLEQFVRFVCQQICLTHIEQLILMMYNRNIFTER